MEIVDLLAVRRQREGADRDVPIWIDYLEDPEFPDRALTEISTPSIAKLFADLVGRLVEAEQLHYRCHVCDVRRGDDGLWHAIIEVVVGQ